MSRIEKIKRQLIEESNRKLLGEDIGDSRYSEYGTDVITVANKFSGGGYAWRKGAGQGTCLPLYHDGNLIRNCDKGGTTHCCGFTLSVAFIVATNRGLLENKTEKQVSKFSSDWYGRKGDEGCGKLCVAALENLGIGREVSLKQAKEGDFCQIWRTPKGGHSVIFKSHIYVGDKIVGFNYRSSQRSTDGIGEPPDGERFSDSGGRMKRKCTFFGRMNS